MTHLKTAVLFPFFALFLPACGGQLVEFLSDSGTADDTGSVDTDTDTEETGDTDTAETGDTDTAETGDTDTGDTGTVNEAPFVESTLPTNGAMGVAVDFAPSARFNERMDATSITEASFILYQGGAAIPGSVSFSGGDNTATFTPDEPLGEGLLYTATVTTGAHDIEGLAMEADYTWEFTTEVLPPMVIATTPLDGALEASVNARPTATFSTEMDPATLTNLTFVLEQGSTPIAGTVTLDSVTNTATFTPDVALDVGLTYTATITTGAEDLSGAALASDYVWSFTTSACSMATIDLGTASGFAVLGGSTVTSTGLTEITGDVGVSPGTAIIGFPPGIIVGSQFAGDPTSAAGIADLTTAYNDAAGRSLCAVTVSGNIGGMTLAPGLYTSTSSLEISSGTLTLDAGGDADAVWIFQMASTLTTSPGLGIVLAGGAKSSNIYWQVGTSATIGTTSAFYGTIMADQAVTLGTGATLDGRALARIAATSLDGNIIVTPAP